MIRSVLWISILITLGTSALSACGSDANETFYVSPVGNDDGPGTEEEPWQTLQASVNRLLPGHTLLARSGIYEEKLVIVKPRESGEEFITIANYPGETPIIDGSNLDVDRGFSALVLIRDQDYLRFSGFELRNFRSEMGRRNPVGIFVTGRGSNIQILNNDIHHMEALTTVGQRDGHGIGVYGTSQQAITNLVIDGNRVHDLILGTSESVVINGNVDGFEVTNNEVFNNDNIGIDIIGFEGIAPSSELDRARNGTVANNHVYGIDTANNPSYNERNAGGVYVDGGTQITIENNVLHHNNMGIEIASEHASGDTSFVTVKNNVVWANHTVGLAMGGYDENRGATFGCTVTNNTFFNNDTDSVGNGEILIQFEVNDNTVTNNLVVAGPQGLLIGNPFVENSGNTFDDNVYFVVGPDGSQGTPEWQWQIESYHDFSTYQSTTANDAGSQYANPDFANADTADFRTESESGASEEVVKRAAELASES